jgi:hypothetical protein
VQAALWDLVWERGGAWSTRIARRAQATDATAPPDDGAVLTLAAPCSLELRPLDAPSTTAPLLAVNATVAAGGTHADFVVSRAQIEALTPGRRFEHRIIVTDAASGHPVVLIRGYVTVRDRVGD